MTIINRILTGLRSLRRNLQKKLNYEGYLQACVDAMPDDHPDWESWEEPQILQTQKWLKRGRKVNVWFQDILLPEGENTHWKSGMFGGNYVPWGILRRYQKLVEDAEYERAKRRREGKEILIKYLTMGAALLARSHR